jgi:hypothetical protein
MFDEKSTPAFIKIEGEKIGSCYVIQGSAEVPNKYRPEIPLQADMIVKTIWEESDMDLAMCIFPILVLIPFRVNITVEVFNDTLVNKIKNISVKHGLWAKFVCDALEQNKNGPKTTNIAKKLISLRDTKKSGDACQVVTKGIRETYVPITAPFIETSLVTKKYPDEQAILCDFFVRNPTPASKSVYVNKDDGNNNNAPEVQIVSTSDARDKNTTAMEASSTISRPPLPISTNNSLRP